MMSEISVAVGPASPEFGSWNWIGRGLLNSLQPHVRVCEFSDVMRPPLADIVVFLKFRPSAEVLHSLKTHGAKLVFIPVDVFGSAAEIDHDYSTLKCFDLILAHSRRLIRYLNVAAPVELVEHPLKYVLPEPKVTGTDGPMLWVGRSCNLPAVSDWFNRSELEHELWILTDTEGRRPTAEQLGFQRPRQIRIAEWSEERHVQWLSHAWLAIDVKASDFRSRHKPPAKAFDFLASGIPVLTNRGSSTDLEMCFRGLQPLYTDSWSCNDLAFERGTRQRNAEIVWAAANAFRVWTDIRRLLLNQRSAGLSGE